MSTELLQNQFIPLNKEGQNPIKTRGKILLWKYTEPNDFGIFLYKTPGFSNQIIISPEKSAIDIALAFNLLDSLGLHNVRDMDIINWPNSFEKRIVSEYYIKNLTTRFGIDEKIHGTHFSSAFTSVGVKPDVKSPLARYIDIYSWPGWESLMNSKIGKIIYAGKIIHEWTHVEQYRNGLPVNSLWSERHAMSEESKIILTLLQTDLNLTPSDKKIIAYFLSTRSKKIEDYRNGINWQNHLIGKESNNDGTPVRKQDYHQDDFMFGY